MNQEIICPHCGDREIIENKKTVVGKAPRRSHTTNAASGTSFMSPPPAQEKRCFSRATAIIEKPGAQDLAIRRKA
jgi:hypothetical protein